MGQQVLMSEFNGIHDWLLNLLDGFREAKHEAKGNTFSRFSVSKGLSGIFVKIYVKKPSPCSMLQASFRTDIIHIFKQAA